MKKGGDLSDPFGSTYVKSSLGNGSNGAINEALSCVEHMGNRLNQGKG